MPNKMPPVAQPIIKMVVAQVPQDLTAASAAPLPSSSRIAGSRARTKIRWPMQSNSQPAAAMMNTSQ